MESDDIRGEMRRRGKRRRRREIRIVWTKTRDVLRVFKIGIMRLLAPEVSGSISAVDMAEMEN